MPNVAFGRLNQDRINTINDRALENGRPGNTNTYFCENSKTHSLSGEGGFWLACLSQSTEHKSWSIILQTYVGETTLGSVVCISGHLAI